MPPARAGRVATVHDLTFVHFPEMCTADVLQYDGLLRRALAGGAWVHTVSDFVRNEVIDLLGAECRDEELQAALAVVEGNATFFMQRWALGFLSAEEQLELSAEAAAQEPPPSTVAPFIDAMRTNVAGALGIAVESTIERRASIPGQEHLPPTLLRLSVGIEAVEDLWTDLDRALRSVPEL